MTGCPFQAKAKRVTAVSPMASFSTRSSEKPFLPPSSLLRTPISSPNYYLFPNLNPTSTSHFPHYDTSRCAIGIRFLPSHSHCLHLDPFPLSFIVYSIVDPDSGDEDGGRTVGADSVKKKRERKMNRHNYRKLRSTSVPDLPGTLSINL